MSKEKTYLKWYNKVGYGSGDVAGNIVYALLTSFIMIYLTDTIGLNAGVIGVLIAVSKIFDGITDIIFGKRSHLVLRKRILLRRRYCCNVGIFQKCRPDKTGAL